MVAFPTPPAAPTPPSDYAAPTPTGAVVTTYAELAAEMALAGPRVIVVADGTYTGAAIQTTQGHHVWAQNRGAVTLEFGIGFRGNAGVAGGSLHGLVFDVDDLADVDPTALLSEAIVNTWDAVAPFTVGSGLLVEDCVFDGHSVIGSGIQAASPGGLTVRRCEFRNFIDVGISAFRNGSGPNDFETIVLEDIVVENVSRPVPGSAGGLNAELAFYLGHRFELRRFRIRDCAWAGVGLINEVNGWVVEDGDIDRVGWGYFVGGSVGIYCEHCHDGDIRRILLGPEMKVGINCEWNGDNADPWLNSLVPRNYDVRIEDVRSQAYKVGIHFDLSVAQCTARRCRIERAWFAAFLDNNNFPDDNGDFPPPGSEDPIVSTNVVDLETCSFVLEPSVPQLLHDHHGGAALAPTIPGWPVDPLLVDLDLLELLVNGRVHVKAFDRLFEFQTQKPNTATLMRLLADRFQSIEESLDLLDAFVPLATATGEWLRIYGKLVDLRRRTGWTDEEFRFFIKAKVVALKSSGSWADIRAVARLMIPAATDPALVRLRPEYPRGYRLEIPDVDPDLRGLALELLSIATEAGVRGWIVFFSSTTNHFAFMPPGTTHGFGAGVFASSAVIVGEIGS